MPTWFDGCVDLAEAVLHLNRLRHDVDAPAEVRRLIEETVDALFQASHRLIVYGSLAPGGIHHGELATLEGEWVEGWVTGTLIERGWGAVAGYPALRWSPGGSRVRAFLLTSADLPRQWPRLDRFEGSAYRRILAPFHAHGVPVAVGNLYATQPRDAA